MLETADEEGGMIVKQEIIIIGVMAVFAVVLVVTVLLVGAQQLRSAAWNDDRIAFYDIDDELRG
jgi:hypothetical protein